MSARIRLVGIGGLCLTLFLVVVFGRLRVSCDFGMCAFGLLLLAYCSLLLFFELLYLLVVCFLGAIFG